MASSLRVIVLKPGKYGADGCVQRYRRGFMPNSTVSYLASLTPAEVDGARCEVVAVDEYVHTTLDYLDLLAREPGRRTLVAFAGVQSHQFQRALDLAALARSRGVEACVIGGPHPMTCDTSELHGRGVSFALSEAEIVLAGDPARCAVRRAAAGLRPGRPLAGAARSAGARSPVAARLNRRARLPIAGQALTAVATG